ncbi:MAG: hypothetical protein ISR76_05225 [Planctomycetes bacterium]|nr:hypothetical protein [Planctomycetota bacterium]MBL7008378.1 hypothetical protein [Planctomycetota bacterium]
MVHLLGIIALVFGAGQGPELPLLPPELAQSEAVSAAVMALEAAVGDEARLGAAQQLLAALNAEAPDHQAAYLMACDGAGVFPASVDLGASWRGLAAGWPQASTAVLATLRQKENADRAPLRGAIRAAGHLELGDGEVVQAIGPQLDQLDAGADARRALWRITGFWFANWAEFEVWWGKARARSRADWLREALDSGQQGQITLWRELLDARPEKALGAVRSSLPQVVRMGLEGMKTLKPDTEGAPEALRQVFERGQDPQVKALVVQLVPRYLQGKEASGLLDLAMTSSAPLVQLEAVKALAQVQPVAEARAGVLRSLGQVYGLQEGPKGSRDFRRELLVALDKVFGNGHAGAQEADPNEEVLTTYLLVALDQEADDKVRTALYSSLGSLRRPAYFDMLRKFAEDEERVVTDRSSALDALTQIGVAHGRSADLLGLLHPLLSHNEPDLRYRALQCLKLVKDPSSLALLNARLAQEGIPSLRVELLRAYQAFGEVAAPADLDPLLNFQPHPDHFSIHRDSLLGQIGRSDLAKLDHAVSVLKGRQSWRLAKELLESFPRDGLDPAALARVDRELTLTTTEWLLIGKLENGRIRQAEAMAGKLATLAAAEPQASQWSVLLGRLLEKLGDGPAAFAAYSGALLQGQGLDAAQRWPLTLSAVRIVAALGEQGQAQAAEALAILDAAGEPPAELADEVGRLRGQLQPPTPVVPDPEPEPGGAALVDPAEVGTEEPPVQDPPPEGDPGGLGDPGGGSSAPPTGSGGTSSESG